MLDIHDHNGQLALESAGLMDEFRAIVLEGRQAMRLVEHDGTLRWGHKVIGTRALGEGRMRSGSPTAPPP